jgi:hypothetical protein
MKHLSLAPLAVLLVWLGRSAAPAAAQNVYPYMQPRYGPGWSTPMSPYLNLLVPGNTAVNYYTLVQPLEQARQYRNVLGQTLQGIVTQLPPPPGIVPGQEFNAPMMAAGHPTAFGYTGTYFGNIAGQSITTAMPQRRAGAGGGAMGYGGRMGMGGMGGMGGMPGMGGMGGMMGGMGGMMGGMGGMMGGMGGGAGVWPNMMPSMGMPGR